MNIKVNSREIVLDAECAEFFNNMDATHLNFWNGESKCRIYGKPYQNAGYGKIQANGRASARKLLEYLKDRNFFKNGMNIKVTKNIKNGFVEIDLNALKADVKADVKDKSIDCSKVPESTDFSKVPEKADTIYKSLTFAIKTLEKDELVFHNTDITTLAELGIFNNDKTITRIESCGSDIKVSHEILVDTTVSVKPEDFKSTIDSWERDGTPWELVI